MTGSAAGAGSSGSAGGAAGRAPESAQWGRHPPAQRAAHGVQFALELGEAEVHAAGSAPELGEEVVKLGHSSRLA